MNLPSPPSMHDGENAKSLNEFSFQGRPRLDVQGSLVLRMDNPSLTVTKELEHTEFSSDEKTGLGPNLFKAKFNLDNLDMGSRKPRAKPWWLG